MNQKPLTLRDTLIFFIPLALSGIMMSAGEPIVHSGLARLPTPELILAAYGVAFYAAVLIEAPIIMLLPASSALVRDESAYRLTRNAMLVINAFLTLIMALIIFSTPLYEFVFLRLLNYPEIVVERARGALALLLLWPATIGVRRFYQGILIRLGHPRIVGLGTAARLLSMVLTVYIGVRYFPELGVLIGGGALIIGVIVDMIIAMVAARKYLLLGALPAHHPTTPKGARSVMGFVRFFLPLALTSTAWVLARPLMLSGIARAQEPTLSLAAFPVAMGTMMVLSGHLRMMQQVVVALVEDPETLRVVRRFAWLVGSVLTSVLGLLAFSYIIYLYHGQVIGLKEPVLSMSNQALQMMVLMPFLTALQAYNQGILIRAEDTIKVNVAALVNLILLVGTLNILAVGTDVPGYLIGGLVLPLALLGEVILLHRWSRPHVKTLLEPTGTFEP